jgi:hypothetical protein
LARSAAYTTIHEFRQTLRTQAQKTDCNNRHITLKSIFVGNLSKKLLIFKANCHLADSGQLGKFDREFLQQAGIMRFTILE